MKYTINSKILGRSITFSRPGSAYIYADLNSKSGALGNQICRGGNTMGSTIMYSGNDQDAFVRICKKWYRGHLALQRVWAEA